MYFRDLHAAAKELLRLDAEQKHWVRVDARERRALPNEVWQLRLRVSNLEARVTELERELLAARR